MNDREQDVIREFVVESHENLSRLDRELVELEKRPKDGALLASIFRTMHTIKGTCGFLGFGTLERISHQAETLLSQMRDGDRDLSPALVSLILETVDATRQVLALIESSGTEGPCRFEDLADRLRAASDSDPGPSGGPASAPRAEPAVEPNPELNAADRLRAASDSAPASSGGPASAPRVEPAVEPKPEENAARSSASDSNIRVGVVLLDKLMDLVGELVLTRNQILQFNAGREDPALNATAQRLNLITSELQEGVMKTRLQPIGMVWSKLPRVVRDMAVSLGKQIRLEMDGESTELDRTIIEAIKDPLVHLVRNACDHGIEAPAARAQAGKSPQGTLSLRAYHEGGQVNIEISDDGAGVDIERVKKKAVEKGLVRPEQARKLTDREAVNFIFQPGFSTMETVTNVSGRGVGLDVVKSHIEKIGGVVDVLSQAGAGVTVKLKIPLTLAIIPGLVITGGNQRSTPRTLSSFGERFVIPQVSLLELVRLEGVAGRAQIERIQGTPVYRRRGSLLPVAYLNEVLGLDSGRDSGVINMVVLQAEDRQFGLVVDGISDTQEIVVKPLGKQLKGLSVYAGATIMGDGKVALILDVLGIGQRSGVLAESREQSHAAAEQETHAANEQQRLLLFRAGSFERLAVPLSLVARLEEFPLSSIERAGGCQVVQYRDRILPLIPLASVLESDHAVALQPPDPVPVIVFNDGGRSVGLIVDQILDVVEDAVTVHQKTSRKGLLGSAVIGKRVADFLDLNYVIRSVAEDWFRGARDIASGRKILLADSSSFSRGLIRSGLDLAGYQVFEAATSEEAIRRLERQPVDLVIAALDLAPHGGAAFLETLRRRPESQAIPVLALAESAAETSLGAGFQDCQIKFDREAMLASVARLASAVAGAEPVPALAQGEKQ